MATEIIKTIKPGGGGDFLTLNAWIATIATRNIVSFDEIQVAECFAGGNLVTPGVTITIPSTITTDATRYVEVRAAPGEHIIGAPFTLSKPRADWTISASPFRIGVADFRCRGIQLRGAGAAGRIVLFTSNLPNGFYVFEENLFVSEGAGATQFPFCLLFNPGAAGGAGGNGANGNNLVLNNIFFLASPDGSVEGAGVAVFVRGSQTKVDCLNNTFVGTPAGQGFFHMLITDAAGLFTDNNYSRASTGTVYGPGANAPTVKGANDVTSNGEATTPARRNIPYNASNFRNPTDVATTFDVHLPVGSALIDDGLDIAAVVNDVSGVAR